MAARPSNRLGKVPRQICESNLIGLRSLLAMYEPDSIEHRFIERVVRQLQLQLQEIYRKEGPTKQAGVLLPPLSERPLPDERWLPILNELYDEIRRCLPLSCVSLCGVEEAIAHHVVVNSRDLFFFPTRDGRLISFHYVGLDTVVQDNPILEPAAVPDLKQRFPESAFYCDPADPTTILTDRNTEKKCVITAGPGWETCIPDTVRAFFARSTFSEAVANPLLLTTDSTDTFKHSPDYRSITWMGEVFTLTTRQALIVQILHEAFVHKNPEISGRYIRSRIGTPDSNLRDSFRRTKKRLWGTLIVPGHRRGTLRLNVSPTETRNFV